ncbi:MAG: NUDIX hydrolase [Alphaproteobacteria bacterium]|nr:NUDIX hydrolase [Alphaproteobacteria bacterium]
MRMEKWTVLESREVYANPPWLRVFSEKVRLPDGMEVDDFHRVQLLDYALMIVEREDGRIILIRQYKQGVRDISLTPPAGGLNPGEDPLETAKRELMEETGHVATNWRKLQEIVTHANQRCSVGHINHATGAHQVAEPNSGDLEEQEILYMTRDEVIAAIRNGEVMTSSALAALCLVLSGILPAR